MLSRRWLTSATLLLGGLPFAAVAAPAVEQWPLEELLAVEIESASRHAQPLAEAPASASVVSAEDIRRFGFRTLGEALEAARGVYLTNDHAYSYLGVRGLNRPGDYNSRVLALVDGVRSNNPLYDQAMIGNESPVDIDWVQRLEFAPGPSSASYGGNALFGIANAVLWNGAELNGTRLAVEAASGGALRASLLGGRRDSSGLDWMGGLAAYSAAGTTLHFPEYGDARRRDGERYLKGIAKAAWGDWSVSLNLADRRRQVPTAYYGTVFNAPGNFVEDRELHLALAYSRPLGPDLAQRLRLNLGRYDYRAEYPYATLTNRDEATAQWWQGEYVLTYTGLANHHLLAGAELRRQTRLGQRNYDIAPYTVRLDIQRRAAGSSFFVQDEWRFAPHWLANLGLRVDNQSAARAMTSPRAALIWQASETATVKAIAGRAFRAPNQYELYYGDAGATQKGNPDLRPERLISRELGLDLTPSPALRLGASYYQYTLYDLIDQEVDPADGLMVFRNQDTVRARGLEFDAELALRGGWRLRGSVSRQHTHRPGSEMVNSPHALGKLLADGPLPWLDAILGVNLQFVGRRQSLAGEVPGHLLANLNLRRPAGRFSTWSLAIHNLGNSRYHDPAGREQQPIDALPAEGRHIRLRWEHAF